MNKNNNKGFTLIELIVVIVILGILAVTAAPKFIDLQSDARKSALQGLKGAMSSAAQMVYGKAVIQGKDKAGVDPTGEGNTYGTKGSFAYVCLDNISTCNDKVKTTHGLPAATVDGIIKVLDLDTSSEWKYLYKDWSSHTDENGNNNHAGSLLGQILITFKDHDFPSQGYYGDLNDTEKQNSKGCYVMYDMPTSTSVRIIVMDSEC